jgi:Zn-finger nucleic acid-binding protein
MSDRDYYAILHVDPSASAEAIAVAYRRLMRQYHPDHNRSPDATRRAQEINEAYDCLSNPARRAAYDLTRPVWIRHNSVLRCPQDRLTLVAKILFGSRVKQCPRCEGVWIERESLVQLYALFNLAPPVILTHPDSPVAGPASSLPCPLDGTTLITIDDKGVSIELCPTCHGAWLTTTRLTKILMRRARTKASAGTSAQPQAPRGPFGIARGIIGAVWQFVADTIVEIIRSVH